MLSLEVTLQENSNGQHLETLSCFHLSRVSQQAGGAYRKPCQNAVDRCFECVALLAVHVTSMCDQQWFVEVKKEHVDMLTVRHPLALIILA